MRAAKQIEFKIEKFGALSRLHPEVLVSMPGAEWADPMVRHLAAVFKAYVPVHEIALARWPKTWWDAFKERWFPNWAKAKWPPQWERFRAIQLMDFGPIPKGRGDTFRTVYLDQTAAFAITDEKGSLRPLRPVPLDVECPSCKMMFSLQKGLAWAEWAKEE
jgi:hypothetical protein